MNKSIRRPSFPKHSFIESSELTLHIIYSVSVMGVDWVKFYARIDDVGASVPWGLWFLDPAIPGVSTVVMAQFMLGGDSTYYTILIADSLITPDYTVARVQGFGNPSDPLGERSLGLTTCDLEHFMGYLLESDHPCVSPYR